jgi:hypothetical protein
VMCNETPQALVDTVTRALTAAGYASEPDPANNVLNAPAYLRVFCQGIPRSKRVDNLNLVFSGTSCERVIVEGEEEYYTLPSDLKALVERVRYNLPCGS